MRGKYLISSDNWFYAPDGKQYKAAWGNVEIVEDFYLGLKTNRNSTNWYAKVGSELNHVLIAGCQIHYAVKCEERPNVEPVGDWQADDKGVVNVYTRPTTIYIGE